MHPEQASSASREEIQETQLPLEPLTLPRKELHQSETKPQDYQLGFFRSSNPNLSIRAPQPSSPSRRAEINCSREERNGR